MSNIHPVLPFSQRTSRYPKRLFTLTFILVIALLMGTGGLFAWSWYGTIEESISGTGQLIPSEKIRKVMAPMPAKVKNVYCHEDQLVHAGDVLIELDTAEDHVETSGIDSQLALLRRDTIALRAAVRGSSGSSQLKNLASIEGSSRGPWLSASNSAYQAEKSDAEMGIQKASHDFQQLIAKQKSTEAELKTSEQQLLNYQTLYQEDGISERELKEYELHVIELRGEFATMKEAVESQKASLGQAEKKTTAVTGSYQRDYWDRVAENEKRIADLQMQAERLHLDEKYRFVRAPIDGYINQQAVHGPGEMVGAGETLLSLVPAKTNLVAEVKVLNRDLAYVYPGQRVALRMDAFSPQHFGRLFGKIISISPSSQEEGAAGPQGQPAMPYYLVRIRPERMVMKANGKIYPLRSGLTVNADIITHKKPLISFFMEPVQIHLDRAFRDPTSR